MTTLIHLIFGAVLSGDFPAASSWIRLKIRPVQDIRIGR